MTEDEIIRQSIRLNRHTTRIVRDRASQMWPELEDNITGIINKIIADWDRLRDTGGGRSAQIAALRSEVEDLRGRVSRLEEKQYDTDHG